MNPLVERTIDRLLWECPKVAALWHDKEPGFREMVEETVHDVMFGLFFRQLRLDPMDDKTIVYLGDALMGKWEAVERYEKEEKAKNPTRWDMLP